MNACGGAVFPVVVNMAAGVRDGMYAKGAEAQKSRRAADASQTLWVVTDRAPMRGKRQEKSPKCKPT
jgi:hypothetical protein